MNAKVLENVVELDRRRVNFDPDQPRAWIPKAELASLAGSIKVNGQQQPVLVRPDPDRKGHFIVIFGERRIRAIDLLKRRWVKAIIKTGKLSALELLDAQIAENIEHCPLNEIEEARAARRYQKLGLTIAKIGVRLRLSDPVIQQRLKLLGLPPSVQEDVATGRLGVGQALEIADFKAKGGHASARPLAKQFMAGKRPHVLTAHRVAKSTAKPWVGRPKTEDPSTLIDQLAGVVKRGNSVIVTLLGINLHSMKGGIRRLTSKAGRKLSEDLGEFAADLKEFQKLVDEIFPS